MKHGYAGQLLEINLTKKTIKKKPLEKKEINKFIGGAGFTVQVLYEEMEPMADPLGPENILCFAPGILVGTNAPSASVTTASAKSPLTGLMGTANSGSFWGSELKYAGYDGIIVKGRAALPVYIYIGNEQVEIISAQHLKGMDSWDTVEQIRQEHKDKNIQVACIGQGGENLCRFASIQNGPYDSWDSAGLGAVMGSKNLKAIAVRGTGSIHVYDRVSFMNAAADYRKAISKSPSYKGIKKNGYILETINLTSHTLAGRNFQTSPDQVRIKSHIRKMVQENCREAIACFSCSTACAQWIEFNEGPYAGLEIKEFSPMPLLGFILGCDLDNLPEAAKLSELCKRYGLDATSAAGAVAFAMELFQRGLLIEKDLGFKIEWGQAETVEKLLKMIAYREGIGAILAEGTKRAGHLIPGSQYYAMQVKGLEIFPSDPRGSMTPGLITNIQGGPGYPLQFLREKVGQVEKIKLLEDMNSIHHILGICTKLPLLLPEGPALLTRLYNSLTGSELSAEELILVGERVWNMQKLFNLREGERSDEALYPDRFFREAISGSKNRKPLDYLQLDRARSEYYACRGWEPNNGRPLEEKLKELSL